MRMATWTEISYTLWLRLLHSVKGGSRSPPPRSHSPFPASPFPLCVFSEVYSVICDSLRCHWSEIMESLPPPPSHPPIPPHQTLCPPLHNPPSIAGACAHSGPGEARHEGHADGAPGQHPGQAQAGHLRHHLDLPQHRRLPPPPPPGKPPCCTNSSSFSPPTLSLTLPSSSFPFHGHALPGFRGL